jgi:hypothetical protein
MSQTGCKGQLLLPTRRRSGERMRGKEARSVKEVPTRNDEIGERPKARQRCGRRRARGRRSVADRAVPGQGVAPQSGALPHCGVRVTGVIAVPSACTV